MFRILKQGKFKIYLVLSCFIVSSVFSGCGGKMDKGKDPNAAQVQQPPVVSEPAVPSADQLVAKGIAADGFTYDYVMTLPDGSNLKQKVWVEAGKMRIEIKSPGSNDTMVAITNLSAGEAFFYQPELKQAMKMPIENSEIDTTSPKDYLEEFAPANTTFIKKDLLDGKQCLVYEMKINGETSTVWIWEEFGLPLRTEMQQDGGKLTVEFKNLELGDIDDAMFTLPKDTVIVKL